MSFLYPLGLLGLLAVPVLIIIYIIKSKYTEQVITSTYLWTLSERFLKRKNPINRITGIISLILQILAVVFISIALAHPVFTLPGKANDYCFVLDGSGSMNIVEEGSTRFQTGKEQIRQIISSAADGSTYTLITTGNTTDVVIQQSEDKKAALRQLDDVKPSCVSANFANAISTAQKYFDANTSCKFYVVTDKDVLFLQNAELIKVGAAVTNYALDGVSYTYNADGSLRVDGTAFSYLGNATVNLDIYADGSETAVTTLPLQLTENAGHAFTVTVPAAEGASSFEFSALTVQIRESDALGLDNRTVLYNAKNDAAHRTLIVSDTPFFINAALASYGNMQREVIATKDYNEDKKGYGLYVFENFAPQKMPNDGAVWFINPPTGIDGTSGFSSRGVENLDDVTNLELSTSTSTRVRALLKDTSTQDVTGVIQYVKCGLYRSFTTLMTCNGDPVVFVGSNTYGNREVVFAIDFHTTDFALSYNGRAIIFNLIEYTFPSLIDDASLYCGDALSINVLANCTGLRVDSPSGKSEYLDTSEAILEYELTEVGEYVITATVGNTRQVAKLYAQLPVDERIPATAEASFVLVGEPGTQKRDGKYEDLLYAFIILAVIVVADWMVYCYEQYQLR